MDVDIEYIKSEYSKLKTQLGRQPASKEFYKQTGISEYQLIQYFQKYSILVSEMGGIKKSFGEKYFEEEEYWKTYGNLTRKLNKIPSGSEWLFHRCKPLRTSYFKKFGVKWSEIPALFYNYAKNSNEWDDIIYLFSDQSEVSVSKDVPLNLELELKYKQYIPPILSDFLRLSIEEGNSHNFEKQVNLVFRMLGF